MWCWTKSVGTNVISVGRNSCMLVSKMLVGSNSTIHSSQPNHMHGGYVSMTNYTIQQHPSSTNLADTQHCTCVISSWLHRMLDGVATINDWFCTSWHDESIRLDVMHRVLSCTHWNQRMQQPCVSLHRFQNLQRLCLPTYRVDSKKTMAVNSMQFHFSQNGTCALVFVHPSVLKPPDI